MKELLEASRRWWQAYLVIVVKIFPLINNRNMWWRARCEFLYLFPHVKIKSWIASK